jgi:hypothetical protein
MNHTHDPPRTHNADDLPSSSVPTTQSSVSNIPSPAIQAIYDCLGYYIRYYPRVALISGNPNFSIVLSRLLYHEGLRLKRHAAFFACTDAQLAAECGLGRYEFLAARDQICAPGLELFTRERHGAPPRNHYRANLERIHAWLVAHAM